MGIIKTLYFIPQAVHLLQAVGTDLFQIGQLIDQFAVLEDRPSVFALKVHSGGVRRL